MPDEKENRDQPQYQDSFEIPLKMGEFLFTEGHFNSPHPKDLNLAKLFPDIKPINLASNRGVVYLISVDLLSQKVKESPELFPDILYPMIKEVRTVFSTVEAGAIEDYPPSMEGMKKRFAQEALRAMKTAAVLIASMTSFIKVYDQISDVVKSNQELQAGTDKRISEATQLAETWIQYLSKRDIIEKNLGNSTESAE